jgi:hypothetical protein
MGHREIYTCTLESSIFIGNNGQNKSRCQFLFDFRLKNFIRQRASKH